MDGCGASRQTCHDIIIPQTALFSERSSTPHRASWPRGTVSDENTDSMAPLLLMTHTVGGWLKRLESGASWRRPNRSKYVSSRLIFSRLAPSPLSHSLLSALPHPGRREKGSVSEYLTRVACLSQLCGFMLTLRKGRRHALRGGCHRRRSNCASRCASLALTNRCGQFAVRTRVDHRDLWHVAHPSFKTNKFLKALIQPRTSTPRKHSHAQACCSPPRAM